MSISSPTRHPFPDTRWSLVLAANCDPTPAAEEAIESICRAYWYPLYAFARHSGRSPHDAQDLTQEFFGQLLEKRWLDSADRDKGRLRTFLIVALKRLMAKNLRSAGALRRGGKHTMVSFDAELAEGRYIKDPVSTRSADETFDRQWAVTLLDLTIDQLRDEFASAGKDRDFEILKDCLMASRGGIDYVDVAKGLGISEGAARVAVHRLRKRFREVYRREISQTVSKETDLDDEIRHLARALGSE